MARVPQRRASAKAAQASLTAEQEAALAVASQLVSIGVSVYHAGLDRIGFPFRDNWPNTPPDQTEVDDWRPGRGLLMITGKVLDAFDYDPRNDPDGTGLAEFTAFLKKAKPKIYGRVKTRSGGWHWWIASLGLAKCDTIFSGVEYKGVGGCVFIPPTVRRSKEDRVKRGYRQISLNLKGPFVPCAKLTEILDPDADEEGPADTGKLIARVLAASPGRRHRRFCRMIYRLQGFMEDGDVVLLAAPLYEKLGWHVNGRSAESDVRGYLAKGDNRPLISEPGELDGVGGPGGSLLSGMKDGGWLTGQKFKKLEFAVPGLLPEGFVVLAGAPKIGKSVLILKFALECARGGSVFGQDCKIRETLYLALEDGDRRVQTRSLELLGGEKDIPSQFHYMLEVRPGKLIATVGAFLDSYPLGLVVVDTLGKVLDKPLKGETTYDRDYRIACALKSQADAHPGSSVVANHHSRKAKADDFVDMVSGTNAITGAADTVIVLTRRRGTSSGVLSIAGRDVEEGSYSIVLERPLGWSLNGDSLWEASMNVDVESSSLGDRSVSLIEFVNKHPEGVTRDDVASVLDMSPGDATTYLYRNYTGGYIRRIKRGVYGPNVKEKVADG